METNTVILKLMFLKMFKSVNIVIEGWKANHKQYLQCYNFIRRNIYIYIYTQSKRILKIYTKIYIFFFLYERTEAVIGRTIVPYGTLHGRRTLQIWLFWTQQWDGNLECLGTKYSQVHFKEAGRLEREGERKRGREKERERTLHYWLWTSHLCHFTPVSLWQFITTGLRK